MHFSKKALAALIGSATSASGTILWDGRFDSSTMADLKAWSWSNAVGDYQNYIHGTGNITEYVALDSSYKNPADSGSALGAKITLDTTSYWEGQTMRRTELIPQTKAAIGSGKVYYHFSMMHTATNPPSIYREHQICFFESHFTEMKSGWISGESGSSDPLLRWDVSSTSQWSTNWTAGVWHNIAYGIDFSAGSVEFYHSTGSDALTLTVPAVSVSASSNGADWHLGVLELPVTGQTDGTEDFYFSGVYIESGSLTTNVAGPGGVVSASSSTSATTSVDSSSVVSSSSAAVVEASSLVASSATSVQAVSSSSAIVSSVVTSPTVAPSSSAIALSTTKKSCTKKASSATTKKSCTKKVSSATAAIPTTVLASPTTLITSKKPCTKKSSTAASISTSLAGNDNAISSSSSSAALTSAVSSFLVTTVTRTVVGTVTEYTSTTVISSAAATATGESGSIAKYYQCGGQNWKGSGTCII
ncbi:hypothetical protein NHQ30_004213 [Ciborinia camelliae]|nr:hypothetical protein NHQ30_004213 [Ciborinia camelliae]